MSERPLVECGEPLSNDFMKHLVAITRGDGRYYAACNTNMELFNITRGSIIRHEVGDVNCGRCWVSSFGKAAIDAEQRWLDKQSQPRPEWTNEVRHFLSDHILDHPGYPADGSGDALLEEIEEAVYGILCRTYGHEIIDDQCGIPAHRYCVYCNKRVGTIEGATNG